MRLISNLLSKINKSRNVPAATTREPSAGLAGEESAQEQIEREVPLKNGATSETVSADTSVAPITFTEIETPAPAAKACTLYQPGDVIAEHFEVTECLQSSLANVYVAYDKIQNLWYVIKQPKPTLLADPGFSPRILKAANAWTDLGMHPHIAHCYFVRNIEEVPHLFVEYVEGGNLRKWIEAGECTDLRASLDWAIQFCHGMERAHGYDLIHRDIKPENILMRREGVLLITDFGILGEEQHYDDFDDNGQGGRTGVHSHVAMGTLAYMSPEQLRDPRQRCKDAPDGVWYDSDIYSFGVCLWEMICGLRPYRVALPVEDALPDPRDSRKDIPDSLRSLLIHMIAMDRSERPQDFKALRESLNSIYQELFRVYAPSYTIELPDSTAADELNNLGCDYLELKDITQARTCFEKAIENFPTHPQATYNLSLIQWRSGEVTDDEVLWRLEYCKNDPTVDRQTLAELIAQVQAERFDPNSAKVMLEDYPDRYEALFGGADVGQVRCLSTLEGHRGWINCVALTPDGSRALSGSDDKSLRFWDLETGNCLRTLEGHKSRINAVALTPDGRWGLSGSDDKTLRLWDLKTGTNTQILKGHESEVTGAALSADGKMALSGSHDKTLGLWDLKTGECVRSLLGHTGRVRSVALTPDGCWGLSGSNDKTLRFWDLKAGECVGTSEDNVRGIKSVALTADGRRGLSGSRDGTLLLWNLETGEPLHEFVGHTHSIDSVALTADVRWALSASRDTTLRLWELETGQCVRILKRQRGYVLAVATTPDGQRTLSGNHDKTIQLWELPLSNRYRAPFRIARHLAFGGEPEAEAVERESTVGPGAIHETKAVDQEPIARQKDRQETPVVDRELTTEPHDDQETDAVDQEPAIARGASFDPVGDSAAWVALREAWESRGFSEDASLTRQYHQLLANGRRTVLLKAKTLRRMTGNNGGFFSVAQSHNTRRGLSGNADATLSLWDLETGEILRTLRGHTDIVSSVAMTPDGHFALSVSADTTLRFWDLITGECLRILGGDTNAFMSAALTPDGRWALTGQRLGFVEDANLLRLWDLARGKLAHAWEGHRDQVRSVALTANGLWGLSGGADNTLRVWDLKTRENVHTLKGHTKAVNAVAMTPEGRWGLSGSHDTTLRLWDLKTGACVRELEGQSEAIRSVALTADGHWGLSGSFDKTLRLWNLGTGECVETLAEHTEYVTCVALTSDGCLGLSASVDNTLVQWRFVWDLEFADSTAPNTESPQ